MCMAALSPLGAAVSGSKAGLGMMSPALAIGSRLFGGKKREKPDRQRTLYPNDMPRGAI